jgi:glycopeptide antibiotics resistance protein
LWQIAEWTTGQVFSITVIFGLSGAITDLIANSVGALLAAFVVFAIHRRAKRPA